MTRLRPLFGPSCRRKQSARLIDEKSIRTRRESLKKGLEITTDPRDWSTSWCRIGVVPVKEGGKKFPARQKTPIKVHSPRRLRLRCHAFRRLDGLSPAGHVARSVQVRWIQARTIIGDGRDGNRWPFELRRTIVGRWNRCRNRSRGATAGLFRQRSFSL